MIRLQWRRLEQQTTSVPTNLTSPAVKLRYLSRHDAVLLESTLKPYDSTNAVQFAEVALSRACSPGS